MQQHADTERVIYSITQLNQEVRSLLELHFPPVWVEGEVSNLRAPGAGHVYFTLKDTGAQLRCALFRMRNAALTFKLKDGMHVLARGRLSLYEERGDFQLIVDTMEEAGDGQLRRAFEALKQRLAELGWFAQAAKQPLPKFPRAVGVVTSPNAAALRDILSVLKRRFPALPVIVYPAQVQGVEAAQQIAQAIALANQRDECEVLIVARGGGSLEDLQPFNDERVARAIFHSRIPIVSGVGHETDVTIADLVADCRAPTPSAAAELVSQHVADYAKQLLRLRQRLVWWMEHSLQQEQRRLTQLSQRLPRLPRRLYDLAQRVDGMQQRLCFAHQHVLLRRQAMLQSTIARLQRYSPQHIVQVQQLRWTTLSQRLVSAMRQQMTQAQQRVAVLARGLDGVSPLGALQRGYALVSQQGRVVMDAAQVAVGETLNVRLARGELDCQVIDRTSRTV